MSLMVFSFWSSSFRSLISWLANFVSFSLSRYSRCSSASRCFTMRETSRSFLFTSFRRSCSLRSASTLATRFAKEASQRSLFVSSSHSWTCALSACILKRFPCTFGFSFRFLQRLLLLSLSLWATSWISLCVSWYLALLQRPLSWPRIAINSSYLRSRSRCSCMMREISSPMYCVSSSAWPGLLFDILVRNCSFFRASSKSTCALKASTSDSLKSDMARPGPP
mmetsp:Transcript_33783/g.80518  ORF Transcript_33783/g.80518 Transcript_33783/m.80518 type:complete len:223 (+) Transcript_33783:583-1251(+)